MGKELTMRNGDVEDAPADDEDDDVDEEDEEE